MAPRTPKEYQEYLNSKLSGIEKFMSGMTAVDERLDASNMILMEILNVLSVMSGINPLEVVNPDQIATGIETVKTVGTAEQLPAIIIPWDHAVVIKALSTNGGIVYIGNSPVEASNTRQAFPLTPSESIPYKIQNLSHIWIDAANDNDGIAWTVEQRSLDHD